MPRQEGQFLVEDFFLNVGGLNTADSPFIVKPDQAVDGQNFDYVKRGGIQKRFGHALLNTAEDPNSDTKGLGLYDAPASNRVVYRAGTRKLQIFDSSAYTFTTCTDDTAGAASNLFASSPFIPVVSSMYTTATGTGSALWLSGGGIANLFGALGSTTFTANGIVAPTVSSFTGTDGGNTDSTLVAGYYTYTLVYRKASTQVISNALVSTSEPIAHVTADTHRVSLSWTFSNVDTTLIDKVYIFRSAVNSNAAGSQGFTTGDLIAIQDIATTTYTDKGGYLSTATSVPRAGNIILDNSQLPVGSLPNASYKTLTTWKRRLVTSKGNTLYLSEVNKPESWPLTNVFTLPTGGDITGLAVVTLVSGITGSSLDEVLCIFKERELWAVVGTDYTNWALNFIDSVGCPAQPLIERANGMLFWASRRGIFAWNGNGKPAYISQPIEDKFLQNGDIDQTKLTEGVAVFYRARNEIQWYLSSTTFGEQKYCLKLDLRLTQQNSENNLLNRVVQGVFTPDVLTYPVYAALAFTPSLTAPQELLYLGDLSGNIYSGYTGNGDGAGSDVTMKYVTPYLMFGSPNTRKRLAKVVVWVLDAGQYNLELDYWANFRSQDAYMSSRSLPITASSLTDFGQWDATATLWDKSLWDTATGSIKALTFVPDSAGSNNEGVSFRLRLTQTGNSAPALIYGFSTYYTEIGTAQ